MCTLPPSPVNCNLSCNCTWQMGTIKPVVRSWLQRIGAGKRGNHFCMEKLKGENDIWEQSENKKSLRKHQMFFSLETLILFYPEEPCTWKSQAAIPVWSRDCQQRVEVNCSMRLREIRRRGMRVCVGERFLPDPVIRCEDRAKKVTGWSIRRQSSVTSTLHGRFWWMLLAWG